MTDQYPSNKYSKSQVRKAGEALVKPTVKDDSELFDHAMDVLSWWRYQHEMPLENAYQLLKKIVNSHEKNAIFAKRLKRQESITRKLQRFERMSLKNMQDIGGCRVILNTPKKVEKIVRDLKKVRNFKDENGRVSINDYIKAPKQDGYRSIHLKGKFPGADNKLFRIELQVRTVLQHSWATALEIVDLFTGQALKSNSGREQWQRFFANVSHQFSVMEQIHLFESMVPEQKIAEYTSRVIKSEDELAACIECQSLSKILSVREKFEAYAQSLKIASEHIQESKIEGYALVEVDANLGAVQTTLFPSDQVAEAELLYIDCEKRAAGSKGILVALVSSSAIGGIKEAYPNFFADSSIFILHLDLINRIPSEKLRERMARFLAPIAGYKP